MALVEPQQGLGKQLSSIRRSAVEGEGCCNIEAFHLNPRGLKI